MSTLSIKSLKPLTGRGILPWVLLDAAVKMITALSVKVTNNHSVTASLDYYVHHVFDKNVISNLDHELKIFDASSKRRPPMEPPM